MNILGIADDLTGASDLALNLAENGMPATLQIGSEPAATACATPARIVALKTRTCPAEDAVRQAQDVAREALAQGVDQVYFKYCSTFDSTDEGNIGPVAEALLTLTGEPLTIVCPAFPDNGRTVLGGRLYVHGVPLAESSMRNHPLTPMQRSDLVALMDAQTRPGSTGLVPLDTVQEGVDAVRAALDRLRQDGKRFAVTDAVRNRDLVTIAKACSGLRLVTGASGLGLGLPANFGFDGSGCEAAQAELPRLAGHPVVIAGSCSEATRAQVGEFNATHRHVRDHPVRVDPLALAANPGALRALSERANAAWAGGPVLVSSAQEPAMIAEAQARLGTEQAAQIVEHALARIAGGLADAGATKFVIAGGETSGAVAAALGARVLRTGPRIAPGVPWMIRSDAHRQVLAFKSGNFGDSGFFQQALELLP